MGSDVEEAKRSRLWPYVAVFAATYAIDYALFVSSWALLGRSVLSGGADWPWLSLWAFSLAAMLPFRMLSTWSAGRIAVNAGALLKRRLLLGAMRLEPDELRADGAGRHLARVFESEAVESLALSGGLLGAAASIELVVAVAILSFAGAPQGLLLVVVLLAFGVLARRYFEERRLWTDQRLDMSHDLVERMVGHRTLVAQEKPERWHGEEDESLTRYAGQSKRVDRLHAMLQLFPRIWLVLGIAALAGASSLELLAVGLGATILASRALTKLTDGFSDLIDSAIAWRRVSPLFHAAARERAAVDRPPESADEALLKGKQVSFRYPGSGEEVLKNVDFEMWRGDRILLTSPSGGGKSTLVSLVNGLRIPTRGVVRNEGTVATAPQFHENHVFTETLAFNLLMGRGWPPEASDWKEAEALCRELGLGELLSKMPGGMNQLVGDTGWQLSHGEKSRLFLARALLQGSDLVLLDESFAALDPENLRQALVTAQERARSLLVVAHV